MTPSVICQQCGRAMAEGETVFAVKVKQATHPLCPECLARLEEKNRIHSSQFTTRMLVNPQMIRVYQGRTAGIEGGDMAVRPDGPPLFAVNISFIKKSLPNVPLNGHEA